MPNNSKLVPSCRVALAAYLHDLGKFSQRARIPIDKSLIDDHKQQYCPQSPKGGWWSHVHAAYTALSFDIIEKNIPEIIGKDVYPFASWGETNVDDSLINAAARHHKPETALQWIIATADRVASGFEREDFEEYNNAKEEDTELNQTGKTFYQARLLSLFEQIDITSDVKIKNKNQLKYRYPLKPLSALSIYPQLADECEPSDNKAAQAEYLAIWDEFTDKIKEIPKSHQRLDLWLDHFDSLWQTYTHAIPSATAGKTKPDVSLYDHSRATAALAVALWQYHEQDQTSDELIIKGLQYRQDWDEEKLLLIQGDLFGIQDFIFSEGSQTTKQAAKLLRGRSFYVSLIAEIAALKILEVLELPSTSQIINAAGKFLIVAANTKATIEKLEQIKLELNTWFLEKTYGQSGVGIAWQTATCNQFVMSKSNKGNKTEGFTDIIRKLFTQLEEAKLQRFDLCGSNSINPVFDQYLDSFDNNLGVCAYNNKLPATERKGELALNALSHDQISVGEHLSKYKRIIISQTTLKEHSLQLDIFGYHINFTDDEKQSGKFGAEVKNNNIRRAFDFSLPVSEEQTLFNGYARRNINTYVATYSTDDLSQQNYKYLSNDDTDDEVKINQIKSFNHLACEDRKPIQANASTFSGIKALCTLKGDVDNLGQIFEKGLQQATFAKMASFSRQMNNFFALALPTLCHKEFPNTYTVFAGGDDFFLIGSWLSQQKLVREMAIKFSDYVAKNEDIHFSAGLLLSKSNIPIPTLAAQSEHELEKSKAYKENDKLTKNAITVFGRTVNWTRYEQLLLQSHKLPEIKQRYDLSSSFIYGLIELCQMAEEAQTNPKKAIWHSWFNYRTARACHDRLKLRDDNHKRAVAEIGDIIAMNGIKQYKADYIVALYNYLYQLRN